MIKEKFLLTFKHVEDKGVKKIHVVIYPKDRTCLQENIFNLIRGAEKKLIERLKKAFKVIAQYELGFVYIQKKRKKKI